MCLSRNLNNSNRIPKYEGTMNLSILCLVGGFVSPKVFRLRLAEPFGVFFLIKKNLLQLTGSAEIQYKPSSEGIDS